MWILVVNDGSSDRTAEIADAYAEKYPTIIKAVHRKTADMEKLSMPASVMPQAFISRL